MANAMVCGRVVFSGRWMTVPAAWCVQPSRVGPCRSASAQPRFEIVRLLRSSRPAASSSTTAHARARSRPKRSVVMMAPNLRRQRRTGDIPAAASARRMPLEIRRTFQPGPTGGPGESVARDGRAHTWNASDASTAVPQRVAQRLDDFVELKHGARPTMHQQQWQRSASRRPGVNGMDALPVHVHRDLPKRIQPRLTRPPVKFGSPVLAQPFEVAPAGPVPTSHCPGTHRATGYGPTVHAGHPARAVEREPRTGRHRLPPCSSCSADRVEGQGLRQRAVARIVGRGTAWR